MNGRSVRVRIVALVGILAVLLTGIALGQEEVAPSGVSDVVLEGNNGGFHLIFYDLSRNACVTYGSVIFYKKAMKIRDVQKMEGRGLDQQIVMDRQIYEEYEPLLKKIFNPSDFRKLRVGVGRGAMALPVKLPGVAAGDQIKIEFGNVRKDIVVGYFD